jgi:hypothetical protein
MDRRGFFVGIAALGALGLEPRSAFGTLAVALSLEELARGSREVFVGTPVESYSIWETLGDARRIVTYTRVLAEHDIKREGSDTELLVRTLGGRVGEVAQLVHGEANLKLNDRTTVFLNSGDDGVLRVTGMAQGEYPLRRDAKGTERLRASYTLPELTRRGTAAAIERLPGLSVSEAHDLVRRAIAP